MGQRIGTPPSAAGYNPMPSGRMYLQGLQDNIVSGAPTRVALNAIDADFTDGIEDVVNHWILPGVDGLYQFNASLFWDTTLDDNHYDLSVHSGRTGSENIRAKAIVTGCTNIGGLEVSVNISGLVWMDNLDHIFILGHHLDGTNNPDFVSTSPKTFLSLHRVR